jgi:hypothetical protein
METVQAELTDRIRRSSIERDRAAAQLGQPFPHASALGAARTRALALAEELTATTAAGTSVVEDRWRATAERIDPQLPQAPSWGPLQAALDRAAAAGFDAETMLSRLGAEHPPTGSDPAGDLLWRLYDICEASAPPVEDLAPAPPPAAVRVAAVEPAPGVHQASAPGIGW